MAKKESLKSQAYTFIRDKIIRCEYAPATMLNEEMLQAEIGVSRTPIRDALSRLEQEGLVQILPKKGVIVSSLSISEINMIFEVRLLLEPYAIEHYGNTHKSSFFEHYFNIFSTLSPETDNDAYYGLDDCFHGEIMRAVPNRYIQNTYQTIATQNYRFRVMTGKQTQSRLNDSTQEHLAILRACMMQDWSLAAEAMRAHIQQSKSSTFELLLQL